MWDGIERRKYQRADAGFPIAFFPELPGAPGARVANFSLGGAFIETEKELQVGDEVDFQFQFPDDDVGRDLLAVVRWRREEAPAGAGVEIVRASPRDLMAIEGYCKLRYGDTQKIEPMG